MMDLYWGCLVGGIIFALVMLVGGGLHHVHGLHHIQGLRHGHGFRLMRFLHPATVVGAVTAFGGAGILLTHGTVLTGGAGFAFAVGIAFVVSVAVHLGVVGPMSRAESSMSLSVADFAGRSGSVTVSIPHTGYGEVMVDLGSLKACRMAASFDSAVIKRGQRIVVVEIRNGVLYVSPIDVLPLDASPIVPQ